MVMEEAMDSEMSLSNMVLGFFEEAERERSWPENDDDDGEGSSGGGAAERKAFWQTQHSQLHEALAKTSPAESRIRADTEEAIKTMRAAGAVCSCARRAAAGDCRSCMLRHVAERLSGAGYNSAICKSKWTRSPDIPSGEHSYVDVVVQTRSGKAVRVVVELSFRTEFEVARASAEYRALVTALPEVFVGRAERLRGVVKAMCAAAKQCMKENNMHMGPWRKHKYMQSKWLGTPERAAVAAAPVAAVTVGSPEKQTKFRASMLSFDFGRSAVEVV